MKNLILFVFLTSFLLPNIDAITKDGKPVILKSDGTWEFIKEDKNHDSEDFGIWNINYYVDEFGDPTTKGYISNKNWIQGKFSNSATTNSPLNAYFIINQGVVTLKLFEYARKHPVKGDISRKSYKILLKHNGQLVEPNIGSYIEGINTSDRILIVQSEQLIELLKSGGEFKFKLIEQGDYSNSTYSFKIDDSSGFSNLYKKFATK